MATRSSKRNASKAQSGGRKKNSSGDESVSRPERRAGPTQSGGRNRRHVIIESDDDDELPASTKVFGMSTQRGGKRQSPRLAESSEDELPAITRSTRSGGKRQSVPLVESSGDESMSEFMSDSDVESVESIEDYEADLDQQLEELACQDDLDAENEAGDLDVQSDMDLSDDVVELAPPKRTGSKRKAAPRRVRRPAKRVRMPVVEKWTLSMFKHISLGEVKDGADIIINEDHLKAYDDDVEFAIRKVHEQALTRFKGKNPFSLSTARLVTRLGVDKLLEMYKKYTPKWTRALLGARTLEAFLQIPAPSEDQLNSMIVYQSAVHRRPDGKKDGKYTGSGTALKRMSRRRPAMGGSRLAAYDRFKGQSIRDEPMPKEARESRHVRAGTEEDAEWDIRITTAFPEGTPRAVVQFFEGSETGVDRTLRKQCRERGHASRRFQHEEAVAAVEATSRLTRERDFEPLNGASPLAQGLHMPGLAERELRFQEVGGVCVECGDALPTPAEAKGQWAMSLTGDPVHQKCQKKNYAAAKRAGRNATERDQDSKKQKAAHDAINVKYAKDLAAYEALSDYEQSITDKPLSRGQKSFRSDNARVAKAMVEYEAMSDNEKSAVAKPLTTSQRAEQKKKAAHEESMAAYDDLSDGIRATTEKPLTKKQQTVKARKIRDAAALAAWEALAPAVKATTSRPVSAVEAAKARTDADKLAHEANMADLANLSDTTRDATLKKQKKMDDKAKKDLERSRTVRSKKPGYKPYTKRNSA